MERDEALALLRRYVTSPSHIIQVAPAVLLLRPFTPNGAHVPALRPVAFGPTHSHATAAVMRKAAEHLGEDAATWEVIGLLHDIDYDIVGGDKERHGVEGYRILIENGVSEEIADIVRRHNHMLFGDYVRPVEVVLQAADSASGLIIACALVKGGAIDEVTPRR